jgi:uncharacterized membrane protein
MADSWYRSIAKGVSWFAIRFTTLFIITYYITNDSTLAGALSTVFYSIGAVLYIVHERVWNRISFGIEG